ncbi:restriction endonuclease subunit S [Chryseobacterium sp. PBS4-4]|uniref:Restriction endonuclease subunit S n=1 Tax=Chryseobacterium edaphi TaxID=2976532 RepID=A0ABT2W845_9FLAO|nr:restriction endonuclease subunit S [Chryseobacterium edaphi]MCU7616850.1 restriction endonuclease subunit S [Chryseobacterium edaphi]
MSNLVSTFNQKNAPYFLDENWTWYYWKDIISSYQQGLIRSNSELNEIDGIDYFKMNFINENGTYTFNGLPKTFATSEEIDNYKIKNGDFFINVRNSKELVGKSCVVYDVNKNILFNHMLVRINHKEYVTGSFINAYFNTIFGKKLIETCKKGTTTVIALYQKDLYNIPIPIPKKNVLEGIDNIYNSINKKIKLNNRINAELEAMAKTLYDYWFVQFDFPVSDTLASTPLSQQSVAEREKITVVERSRDYKSSGGKMVYNETLKREIPEGWEVTVFNDWIKDTKAGDWGKEEIEGNYTERVYCIRGADINGINGKGEVKTPERFILKSNSSKKLMPNDFVVEISGGSPVQSTGRIALITESTLERFDTDIICSNFCKAVSIKDEKYIYNFKQEWQRLYDAGVFFGFEGKTSGIKNFLFDSFMNSYSIVLPKKEIVEKYYEFLKSTDKKIQSNLKQNQELSALRDWLLPMLMNGQVKVGEAEAQVLGIVAKLDASYDRSSQKSDDELFEVWLKEEGLAARGDIDRSTLRELFDAMDDEDK